MAQSQPAVGPLSTAGSLTERWLTRFVKENNHLLYSPFGVLQLSSPSLSVLFLRRNFVLGLERCNLFSCQFAVLQGARILVRTAKQEGEWTMAHVTSLCGG